MQMSYARMRFCAFLDMAMFSGSIASEHLALYFSPATDQALPDFDGLDRVRKRLFQDALADCAQYEAKQPPLEVFPVRTTTTSMSVVPLGRLVNV